MISIIHPSRSRPRLSFEVARMWLLSAGCEVEYISSVDVDDPRRVEYIETFKDLHRVTPCRKRKEVVAFNRSAIESINRAAKDSTGDIIVQIADDFQCFPDWGKRLEELMAGQKDWILKTQDGIQPWIITLPIMDRVYYERFGYIYHSSYKHCWADTELTCVAELTGRKQTSKLLFRHLNDGATKIVDELSKRNDATFEEGKRLFIDRKKNNFGLHLWDIAGTMTPNFYTNLQ